MMKIVARFIEIPRTRGYCIKQNAC